MSGETQLSLKANSDNNQNSTTKSLESKFAKLGEFEDELLRNEREMGVCKFRILLHAIRNGELLKRIKKTLKHGEFGIWVKAVAKPKLGISHRTVNRYLACYDKRQAILAGVRRELIKLGVSPTQDAIEAKLASLSLREVDVLLFDPSKSDTGDQNDAHASQNEAPEARTSLAILDTPQAAEWRRAIEYFVIDSSPHACTNVNYLFSDTAPQSLPVHDRHVVAVVKNFTLAGWLEVAQAALNRDELDAALMLIVGEWNPEVFRAVKVFPAILRPNTAGVKCLLGVLRPDRVADFYRAFQALGINTIPQELVPQLISAIA